MDQGCEHTHTGVDRAQTDVAVRPASLVRPCLLLCLFVQPCHAEFIVFVPSSVPLIPRNAPRSDPFTVQFNLPFGAATATEPELDAAACRAKAGNFITRMRELDSFPIWVDDEDPLGNAYFNCSTGASYDPFLTAYDGSSDPPSLNIVVRRGDGVALATKFFIALCVVGVLLAALGLLLRWWEDKHPPALQSEAGRRDRSQFAPLEADDDELGAGGGDQEYRLAETPARSSSMPRVSRSQHSHHSAAAAPSDIELVDAHFDRDELEALEYKEDLEQVDPPSRGARMMQHDVSSSGASSPRTPVPKLHPPPAPANAADLSAEERSRDLELASFEEEMLRHQHAIGSQDGYNPSG